MSSDLFGSTNFAGRTAAGERDLRGLPPFLRVLLTTDGTVTKSLEAYFWEPVEVKALRQTYESAASTAAEFTYDPDAAVLVRQVQLVGVQSHRLYARADSVILTAMLPQPIRTSLEEGEVGIGELLRERGLETYRKVLQIGLGDLEGEPCVWRVYLIYTSGKPFIQIKEWFYLRHFQP